jgi:hypothetical protein
LLDNALRLPSDNWGRKRRLCETDAKKSEPGTTYKDIGNMEFICPLTALKPG